MQLTAISAPETEAQILQRVTATGAEGFTAATQHGVTAEDFESRFNQAAFRTIGQIFAEGLPITPDRLWERLEASKQNDGKAFLRVTDASAISLLDLPALCSDLRATTTRRRVHRLAVMLQDAAESKPEDVDGIMAKLLEAQSGASARALPWTAVCDAAIAEAKQAIAGKLDDAKSVPWGWRSFDRQFKPLKRGELVIIAARPSVGKSSLLRGIAYKNGLAGRAVLIETLEVSALDVALHMAASLSGIPHGDLERMHPRDQADFMAELGRIKTAPLHVHEDRSLAAIAARARAIHSSTPLAILALDYLGLLSDCEPQKGETKAQAIGRVTKALKALARDLNIVVIAAAQLNRGPATEGNREPRLSDLRDSGDIEQDADRALFIHRPDTCPFTKSSQDVLTPPEDLPRYGCVLLQLKGRNCGTAFGAVTFTRRLARFDDPDGEPPANGRN